MTPESIMRGHTYFCLLLMAGKINNGLGGSMGKKKIRFRKKGNEITIKTRGKAKPFLFARGN